jgi:hypothetical protein
LIKRRLERGRWQQLHWGVYAVFTGPPPRQAWLWAAVLRAGPGTVLSHLTAAELHGLLRRDSRRDNQAGAEGILTARYGWRDVCGHPCETALLQARILRKRGWTGQPRPCSPACPVGAAITATIDLRSLRRSRQPLGEAPRLS